MSERRGRTRGRRHPCGRDGRFVFGGRRVPTPGTYFGASVGLEARDLDGGAAPDVVPSTPGGFSGVRQLP